MELISNISKAGIFGGVFVFEGVGDYTLKDSFFLFPSDLPRRSYLPEWIMSCLIIRWFCKLFCCPFFYSKKIKYCRIKSGSNE